MANFSSTLRMTLPVTGEFDDSWGDKINTNMEILEAGLAGQASISVSSGTYILSTADGAVAGDEARNLSLYVTGALASSAATILIPSAKKKFYVIHNATTGGYELRLGPNTSNYAVLPSGDSLVYTDGNNTRVLDLSGTATITGMQEDISDNTDAINETTARLNTQIDRINGIATAVINSQLPIGTIIATSMGPLTEGVAPNYGSWANGATDPSQNLREKTLVGANLAASSPFRPDGSVGGLYTMHSSQLGDAFNNYPPYHVVTFHRRVA